MAECHRCGRKTDRRTLTDEALCPHCADWINNHDESRAAEQHGLEDYANQEAADGGRVVVEFRDRQPGGPTPHGGHGGERDPGEAVVTCYLCGYSGIIDDDPVAVNAAHPETDGELVCATCDRCDGGGADA